MIDELASVEGVVVVGKGDDPGSIDMDGKIVLVNIDGFTTARDERLPFLEHEHVFYYEADPRAEDVVFSSLLPQEEAVARLNSSTVFYYPKNEECDAFMRSIPGVTLKRFGNVETLIVSHYYLKARETYEYHLFTQLACALPNIDVYEIQEALNIGIPNHVETDSLRKLYACACASARKDQMRGIEHAIGFVEKFPIDMSQKFERYGSVGIIGLNDFSRRVAENLSDRMLVDIYDDDYTVEQLREISRDASNSLPRIVRTCNSLLVAKDYKLTDKDISGKMVFDICGAFAGRQTPNIKTIGKRGWLLWQK